MQKDIIEQFAPRFAPGCVCLYVGDTTRKDLVKDVGMLEKLGFEITLHDKMHDVVLYREDKDWLYFIEAVTSIGPISPQRLIELSDLMANVASGKIYVTAFPDKATYVRAGQKGPTQSRVKRANPRPSKRANREIKREYFSISV